MHACFVRPLWMRYPRPAGEKVFHTLSSYTYHLLRSRRHRQVRMLLGKRHKSRVLPCSRVRGTNVSYVDLLLG